MNIAICDDDASEQSLNIEELKRGIWSLSYGLTDRLTRR